MKLLFTLIVISSLWSTNAHAATVEGRVLNILSGDKIEIMATNRRAYTIRLEGIKSPNSKSRAGRIAQKHLAMLVAGKALRIEYKKIDRKGVLLGTVKLGGYDINLRQISDGMALAVPKLLSNDLKIHYQTAELKARQGQMGVWRLPKEELREAFIGR